MSFQILKILGKCFRLPYFSYKIFAINFFLGKENSNDQYTVTHQNKVLRNIQSNFSENFICKVNSQTNVKYDSFH